VRLLLAAPGVDVNAANAGGGTPLCIACQLRRVEIVRLLLGAPEVDVNANGHTAIQLTRRHPGIIVRMLLDAGAHE